ncbi:MAG: hypothetical protein IK058_00930 [Bacteroidales bacterium]|nr:hypothetical protein [Bacteroidales bacterium]
MKYHDKEELLFRRWAERARKLHESDEITKDGLLYRGDLWFDGFNQICKPGDEELQWDDASLRLLVLTKELNEDDGWDIRGESGRVPSPRLTCRTAMRFFPNLELWVYGLMNIPNRKVMTFNSADNQTRLQGFYENAPIARVNCKKQPDIKSASNLVLQKYLRDYADLLAGQVTLYDADIILCVGGQGVMVKFLAEHVYKDLAQFNEHIYFSPSAGVVVVKQYHPNYNVYSRKDMYVSLMNDYQAFLKAYPAFPRQR